MELRAAAVQALMRDARLDIPDENISFFKDSVGAVLEYAALLQQLQSTAQVSVQVTLDTAMQQKVSREDVTRPSRGQVLVQMAPLHEEGYFVVPAAIVHELKPSRTP